MGHTKKPDRFESMPDTVGIAHEDDCHLHNAVVSLLRRQHRAYVRLVRKQACSGCLEHMGCNRILDAILAAFTRYAKGKETT